MAKTRYEVEELEQMSNSELHRLMSGVRAEYGVFNLFVNNARGRIKRLQSVLFKRGDRNPSPRIPYDHTSLKRPPIGGGVSEHALIRYLERVKGVDMKEIEREIRERIDGGESFYSGSIVIDKEGIGYLMRDDGLVKSVMPEDWLSEADRLNVEREYKHERAQQRSDHFRALAAQGLDTDPRKRLDKKGETPVRVSPT